MLGLSREAILSNHCPFASAAEETASRAATSNGESRLYHAARTRPARTISRSLAGNVGLAAIQSSAFEKSAAASLRLSFHSSQNHPRRLSPSKNQNTNRHPALVLSSSTRVDSSPLTAPSRVDTDSRLGTLVLIRRWTLGVGRWTFAPFVKDIDQLPDSHGHFGPYGGMFVPETLISALNDLTAEYNRAKSDPGFQRELDDLLHDFAGRPTPLYFAERLTKNLGGAKIYLKREDLLHTGAHKINNALGQILLARRMGKTRIIAETGAGQHGVATATVAAHFGYECAIYMGSVDMERQALNVARMCFLGAKVVPVTAGPSTLQAALPETIRHLAEDRRS